MVAMVVATPVVRSEVIAATAMSMPLAMAELIHQATVASIALVAAAIVAKVVMAGEKRAVVTGLSAELRAEAKPEEVGTMQETSPAEATPEANSDSDFCRKTQEVERTGAET